MLKVFRCKHCENHFVIVKANNTFIPVNCKADDVYPDDIVFERNSMRSHLRDCDGRRDDWQRVVKFYLIYPQQRIAAEKKEYEPVRMEEEEDLAAARKRKIFEKILSDEIKSKGLQ